MSEKRELSVKSAYDLWAEVYDEADNPMVAAASLALDRLDGIADADVVEFGCGTGRNLALFESKGASRLVGFDLSEKMLAKARERCTAFDLFQHDMAEPVGLSDACADIVVICLTLEHISSIGPVIDEAARILRPDGRLIVFEIHPFLSARGVAAHFEDGRGEVHMPTYAHPFADYLNAFAAAGLYVGSCTEWRPIDFGDDSTEKMNKRGGETPLAVEFRCAHRLAA